jgi:hypothetical protein
MAKISKEAITWLDGTANLIPRNVIVVKVGSFTFRFKNVDQLRECIDYYQKKTHPSSRVAAKTLAADLGGTGEMKGDGKSSGGLSLFQCISLRNQNGKKF